MATYDISVCIDCLVMIANGEGEEGTAAGIAREWPNAELTLGSLKCEYCDRSGERDNPCDEGWFSCSSCDGCGSHLGGTRYHATAWDKEEPEPSVEETCDHEVVGSPPYCALCGATGRD